MTTPPTLIRFDDAGPAGVSVPLDVLLRTRLLVQANSGGGKSHLLRSLLEQTHGRVQQIVFDPEGEFATLRPTFPFVLAGADGDLPAHPKTAKVLCQRLMETGTSAILDLFELSQTERREFVRIFLTEMLHLPRRLWHPTLVVLDESHVFCPERGAGEAQSTDAVIALCTLGRKRQFAAVLATQRISKLHKDAAAELGNKLIGRTGLDVDMKRAGDELGFDRESRLALRSLEPGEFFAFGPAIGTGVMRVRSTETRTQPAKHGDMVVPSRPANIAAMLEAIGDLPAIARAEEDELTRLRGEVQTLRKQVRSRAAVPDEARERELAREIAALRQQMGQMTADRAALAQTMAQVGGALAEAHRLIVETEASTARIPVPDARPRLPQPAPPASVPSHPEPWLRKVQVAPSGPLIVIPTPRPPAKTVAADPSRSEKVSGPQGRMLDVLASFAAVGLEAVPYGIVAVRSGQSPKSSGFDKNLSTLVSSGYAERRGNRTLAITSEGLVLTAPHQPPASLQELHAAWFAFVSGPQQRMLHAIIEDYPKPVPAVELAPRSGQSPTSSGSYNTAGTLCTLQLLVRQPGRLLAAGPLLYPEGLR